MNSRKQKLKDSCIEEIKRVLAYFQSKQLSVLPQPLILFTLKGVVAGRCCPRKNCINLNLELLMQEGSKFLNRTPGHEAVHWAEFHIHGSSNHGKRWKEMMREVGIDDARCHDYDCTNVKRKLKRYNYKCNCRTHSISGIKHNKILKGWSYQCLFCNQKISLIIE